jgi:hypothetical protein
LKSTFIFFAVCVAAASWGERLFRIPTGFILSKGEFRLEFDSPFHSSQIHHEWLQYGITDHFELQMSSDSGPGIDSRQGLDIAYNILPPILEELPGISLGVRDLFDRTDQGRSYYLVTTFRTALENSPAGEKQLFLHFGYGVGGIKGVFVGLDLPLANNLSVQAEHDSRQISAGLLWNPAKALGIRLFMQDQRAAWGVTFSRRL